MARWSGARWRPLPEQGTQRRIKPTQLVLHSAVGRGSVWGYFAKASVVVESTFWIGLDGRAEQYMDSAEKAEAQALGNPRAISVETADDGHPDRFPWTDAQVETLAQLAAWCHREHGIPLRVCPSWDAPGIGYHRLWRQWNPNTHSCPGTVRVRQVPQIIARAQQIVSGETPAPAPTEDDMPLTPADVKLILETKVPSGIIRGQSGQTVEWLLATAAAAAHDARRAAAEAVARVAALEAAIAAGAGGAVDASVITAAGKAGAAAALAELGHDLLDQAG